VRDRRQGQRLRVQGQHDRPRLPNPAEEGALAGGWGLGGTVAFGRRLSRLRAGLAQGRDHLLRGWGPRANGGKHPLAPAALPDLRLPDDADLPSTFSVEYVRAWKRR